MPARWPADDKASVDQPSGSTASTHPSEPVLQTCSSTRAPVTHYRRRWRHGDHGMQHAGANKAVETKLRVQGASVAHRGCSGALGGDGERLERPGHGKARVAVGRRRWAWEQAVRRLVCENGELRWSTRCARMRRLYWCSLRGRRWLDSGSGERRSCAAAVAKTRKKKTFSLNSSYL
jgi:hypothetical protein